MKTKNIEKITEGEKILKSLTGHFESDKKKLIDGIHYLRKIDAPTSQCLCLGVQLYKLLLENGLNESDVINPSRLMDKVDGFMYNNQADMALAIVEVVDAVQRFQKRDGEGLKVYCFENEVEAKIFENSGVLAKAVTWIKSLRPNLLLTKAQILEEVNPKLVQQTVDEALELNPVFFNAIMYQASTFREKNPKKYFQLLNDAWKVAYSPEQMITLLIAYYNYYLDKEDYVTAYAVLSSIKVYDDSQNLLDELENLKQKMTHTVVTPFKVPTAEQILKILERENISVFIPDDNYNILVKTYEKSYLDGDDIEMQKNLAKMIQEFAGQEDIIKVIQKRLKK